MTIPMDSALSFTAGHVFAVAGAEAIAEDQEKEKECLNRGRLFTAMVTVPVGLYFLVRWPDWSWMYFNERPRSPVLGAAGLSFYMLAHELGFRNAARLLRRGERGEALRQTAGALMLTVIMALVGLSRLRWIGTLEEYHEGTASDVFRDKSFLLSIVAAGALAALPALAVMARNYLK